MFGFALGAPEIFILGFLCTVAVVVPVVVVVLVVVLGRPRQPPDDGSSCGESERP
jgi:hypothetical protein